jgi:hypothetical protein
MKTGVCYQGPISNKTFDFDRNFTQNQVNSGLGFSIKMKTINSILLLDSNYTFTGYRQVNYIPSDIFISERKDLDTQNMQFIYEYAFSSQQIKVSNVDMTTEQSVPVRLMIKYPPSDSKDSDANNKLTAFISYYDYTKAFTDLEWFNIEDCFPRSSQARIEFVLQLKPLDLNLAKGLDLNRHFRTSFVAYISNELLKESPMRFVAPKISLNSKGIIIVRSAVLRGPDPLNLFTKYEKVKLNVDKNSSKLATSPEVCAFFCLDQDGCLSFDWKPNSCVLYNDHISNSTFIDVDFGSTYDHYSRNSLNDIKLRSSFLLWTTLRDTINAMINNREAFRLDTKMFNGTNQDKALYLQPIRIDESISNPNQFGTSNLL